MLQIIEPFTRTNYTKRAFHCSAPAVWNSLPRTVLDCVTLSTLKSKLKAFLFSHTFSHDSRHLVISITRTPLATHPWARQVQSDMPWSPVAVRPGTSILGRRLASRVRQHSALSALSWRFGLLGVVNTQQLWGQNFCSRGTSPVELFSSPAA